MVLVRVTEAYIHCSKHIPKLIPQSRVRHWGTDNPRYKGGDIFGIAAGGLGRPDGLPPAPGDPGDNGTVVERPATPVALAGPHAISTP